MGEGETLGIYVEQSAVINYNYRWVAPYIHVKLYVLREGNVSQMCFMEEVKTQRAIEIYIATKYT
jgi:hypothetical protein